MLLQLGYRDDLGHRDDFGDDGLIAYKRRFLRISLLITTRRNVCLYDTSAKERGR